ncbi:hypothetical protein ID866_2413 [Astraeus odoratus]|nr:hypothetical protein ID866_2413 [Astraeus odoratus]
MTSSSSSSPEMQPAPTADTTERFTYKHATHEEVLEDLSSRFLLNLPEEELSSLERICFQVEQAHWFYEDFVREQNPKFPSLPLKKFSEMLFHACPLLHQWSHDHEQAFNTFMQYKTRVPVCGAIMLNETWEKACRWKSSSGWGFPKGKINEDEPPHECAVREVLEETGYNLVGKINPADVIERTIREQLISLYIVPGVPDDFPFKTRTRKEISRIEWFKLTDLPTWKRIKASPGKFYLISPFIAALKAFITARKARTLGTWNRKVVPLAIAEIRPQESSSSSADNGEPRTPSSQCSETVPTNNGPSVAAPRNDEDTDFASQPVDPHFARLLNSLSLSAKKADPESSSVLSSLPPTVEPSHNVAHHCSPSVASSSYNRGRSLGFDMSDHLNKFSADKRTEDAHISGAGAVQETASLEHLNAGLSLSAHPIITSSTHTLSSTIALSTPSAISSVPSMPSVSKHTPSSRRSASTADISPYLTRPTEIPTSGKRLRQLALLESVADESSKMTPSLMSRELPTVHGRECFSERHPGPCASVPPPAAYGTLGDRRFRYDTISHGSGLLPMHCAGTNLPAFQQSVAAPSFQVRPQSSQRSRYEPPFTAGSQAHRVHQTQLLSLLGRDTSTDTYVPPLPLAQPSPFFHSSISPNAAANPNRIALQPTLPAAAVPPTLPRVPFSAVPTLASSPPPPRPPPRSSVQLLSILNSSSPVGGEVRSGYPPAAGAPAHAG